jgi:hypothetical protein
VPLDSPDTVAEEAGAFTVVVACAVPPIYGVTV